MRAETWDEAAFCPHEQAARNGSAGVIRAKSTDGRRTLTINMQRCCGSKLLISLARRAGLPRCCDFNRLGCQTILSAFPVAKGIVKPERSAAALQGIG